VLLDRLLADGSLLAAEAPDDADDGRRRDAVTRSLAADRNGRGSWWAELLGPLLVPVPLAPLLAEVAGADEHGRTVVLVARRVPELAALPAALDALRQGGHVEVVAVQVPLPPAPSPQEAARLLLDGLALSVPTRVVVPPGSGWADVLAVVAEDGAEELALACCGAPGAADTATWPVADLAGFVRRSVDATVTVHGTGTDLEPVRSPAVDGTGVLNLLCAVRAALNGASTAELTDVLTETSPDPLSAAVRRMSDADAAVVRAFLGSVSCADPAAVADRLAGLGLRPES
jgi:hypothetical protein